MNRNGKCYFFSKEEAEEINENKNAQTFILLGLNKFNAESMFAKKRKKKRYITYCVICPVMRNKYNYWATTSFSCKNSRNVLI